MRMKFRTGFVSNSSSSSYVVLGVFVYNEIIELINKAVENGDLNLALDIMVECCNSFDSDCDGYLGMGISVNNNHEAKITMPENITISDLKKKIVAEICYINNILGTKISTDVKSYGNAWTNT